MHNAHPSHPKNVSFSFKKIDERMAQITTERAPSGVYTNNEGAGIRILQELTTTMASTKA
jgi:hypothetical protein